MRELLATILDSHNSPPVPDQGDKKSRLAKRCLLFIVSWPPIESTWEFVHRAFRRKRWPAWEPLCRSMGASPVWSHLSSGPMTAVGALPAPRRHARVSEDMWSCTFYWRDIIVGDTQAAQGTAFQITGERSLPHCLRWHFCLFSWNGSIICFQCQKNNLKRKKQQVQDCSYRLFNAMFIAFRYELYHLHSWLQLTKFQNGMRLIISRNKEVTSVISFHYVVPSTPELFWRHKFIYI